MIFVRNFVECAEQDSLVPEEEKPTCLPEHFRRVNVLEHIRIPSREVVYTCCGTACSSRGKQAYHSSAASAATSTRMGSSHSSCNIQAGTQPHTLLLATFHAPCIRPGGSFHWTRAHYCLSHSLVPDPRLMTSYISDILTGHTAAPSRSRSVRFRAIADQYLSVEQVQVALQREGLESCNLIVAVDFTKVL